MGVAAAGHSRQAAWVAESRAPAASPRRCPPSRWGLSRQRLIPPPPARPPAAHLWNNELHYEGHAHCKKLIVYNEPLLAHYRNNELGSLYLKPQ